MHAHNGAYTCVLDQHALMFALERAVYSRYNVFTVQRHRPCNDGNYGSTQARSQLMLLRGAIQFLRGGGGRGAGTSGQYF